MRITRYAATLAAFGLVLTGCASEAGNQADGAAENTAAVEDVEFDAGTTMAELNEAGKITVGTKFDQPGFGLLNPQTDEPEGFDVEIAKLIAAKLGIEAENITWTETVSANREPFIQNGQVDIVVATYTINDTRKQVVDFAGPYYEAGQDIMVAKGNPEDIAGPDDLAGKTVCSVEGSTPAAEHPGQLPRGAADDLRRLLQVRRRPEERQRPGRHDRQRHPHRPGRRQPGRLRAGRQPVHRGAVRRRPDPGRHEFRNFINDVLEESFEDGTWAEAWDRTAGDITGTEAPEPPQVDRY